MKIFILIFPIIFLLSFKTYCIVPVINSSDKGFAPEAQALSQPEYSVEFAKPEVIHSVTKPNEIEIQHVTPQNAHILIQPKRV